MNLILSLVIIVANIYAILKIAQSTAPTVHKTVWIALVILLPILGVIAWFFAGPGDKTTI